ncbi:MAG: hypothetical protein JWM56_50 [Candidatus Peribacteria bacterium]|nr:hypothetical protein [Candidatus Peribacteria bacterium]
MAYLVYTVRMRRLLITADDLGVNAQRSHGIFQCMEFGIVTGSGLVPNGADADAAARHARERKVTAGLHINLTDEYPLTAQDDVATLLEMNGMFMGKDRFLKALKAGDIRMEHLEREIRAQVEWCFDSYGSPSHISSHHHVHIQPQIAEIIMPLMERYGIRFVRTPHEEPLPPFGFDIPAEQLQAAVVLGREAVPAKEMYEANGFQSTDHFRGLSLLGNASLKNLRHILGKLPEGTTELMVHPGSNVTYGTPFDLDPQRQTEFRMLMDDSIPALLGEKKIELCGWGDL